MKRAFALEILIMICSGFAAILIWEGNWIGDIIGFIILVLTSYIVGDLKKVTLEEYIEKSFKLSSAKEVKE